MVFRRKSSQLAPHAKYESKGPENRTGPFGKAFSCAHLLIELSQEGLSCTLEEVWHEEGD